MVNLHRRAPSLPCILSTSAVGCLFGAKFGKKIDEMWLNSNKAYTSCKTIINKGVMGTI